MSALPRYDLRYIRRREAEKKLRWKRDAVLRYWQRRPCWICGRTGYCLHRELLIAEAEAERTWGRKSALSEKS